MRPRIPSRSAPPSRPSRRAPRCGPRPGSTPGSTNSRSSRTQTGAVQALQDARAALDEEFAKEAENNPLLQGHYGALQFSEDKARTTAAFVQQVERERGAAVSAAVREDYSTRLGQWAGFVLQAETPEERDRYVAAFGSYMNEAREKGIVGYQGLAMQAIMDATDAASRDQVVGPETAEALLSDLRGLRDHRGVPLDASDATRIQIAKLQKELGDREISRDNKIIELRSRTRADLKAAFTGLAARAMYEAPGAGNDPRSAGADVLKGYLKDPKVLTSLSDAGIDLEDIEGTLRGVITELHHNVETAEGLEDVTLERTIRGAAQDGTPPDVLTEMVLASGISGENRKRLLEEIDPNGDLANVRETSEYKRGLWGLGRSGGPYTIPEALPTKVSDALADTQRELLDAYDSLINEAVGGAELDDTARLAAGVRAAGSKEARALLDRWRTDVRGATETYETLLNDAQLAVDANDFDGAARYMAQLGGSTAVPTLARERTQKRVERTGIINNMVNAEINMLVDDLREALEEKNPTKFRAVRSNVLASFGDDMRAEGRRLDTDPNFRQNFRVALRERHDAEMAPYTAKVPAGEIAAPKTLAGFDVNMDAYNAIRTDVEAGIGRGTVAGRFAVDEVDQRVYKTLDGLGEWLNFKSDARILNDATAAILKVPKDRQGDAWASIHAANYIPADVVRAGKTTVGLRLHQDAFGGLGIGTGAFGRDEADLRRVIEERGGVVKTVNYGIGLFRAIESADVEFPVTFDTPKFRPYGTLYYSSEAKLDEELADTALTDALFRDMGLEFETPEKRAIFVDRYRQHQLYLLRNHNPGVE